MEHEDAAHGECLINLSNFPAVARWSRIKDRQMNRSVGGGKKEEGVGNAGVCPRLQEEGAIPRPMNPSSPRTAARVYDSHVHGVAELL